MNTVKNLNRMIRVPKRILEEKQLTSEEKIFYIVLIDNVGLNETSIIPKEKSNERTKYILKRLKKFHAIERWMETPNGIFVKFNLKEFLNDEA